MKLEEESYLYRASTEVTFMSIKKIAILSIFVSCALSVNYLESFVALPIPCVRLGMSNIFSLTALLLFGVNEAIFVICARLLFIYIFTGNVLAISCSIVGSISSLLAEQILYSYIKINSPILISLLGAFFFNIGQLIVVYILINSSKVFCVAPLIFIIGIPTGAIVGFFTSKLLNICRRL